MRNINVSNIKNFKKKKKYGISIYFITSMKTSIYCDYQYKCFKYKSIFFLNF